MINAVIICEYNPFHNGHLRQLELTRNRLGESVTITAIMSGNYVQRGELASSPKYKRAEAAVKCGCDLVLELPHPWSCASAEFFARAGVHIADMLGVFDALCFGCEKITGEYSGDGLHRELSHTAAEDRVIKLFYRYLCRRSKLIYNEYPEREGGSKLYEAEKAYKAKYGGSAFYPVLPNDILAAEYISALGKAGSRIIPIPLPRIKGLSATASRKAWEHGDLAAIDRLLPPDAAMLCKAQGTPVNSDSLGPALPMFFRLADPSELETYCDAGGGLARRLCKAAKSSLSAQELYLSAAAKHLTSAKIRRAALNCLFGVTYDEVCNLPPFTTLLAANSRGIKLLRQIKKETQLPVITKPADYRELDEKAAFAFLRCLRADSIYMLAHGDRGDPIKHSPFILKE